MSEENAAVDLEDEVLVDTRVAARILSMSPETLKLWRVQGKGPAYYKIGKNVRYSTRDLNQYACRVTE